MRKRKSRAKTKMSGPINDTEDLTGFFLSIVNIYETGNRTLNTLRSTNDISVLENINRRLEGSLDESRKNHRKHLKDPENAQNDAQNSRCVFLFCESRCENLHLISVCIFLKRGVYF